LDTPTAAGFAARRPRSSASGSPTTRCSPTPPACTSPTAWNPAHYALYLEARKRNNSCDGLPLLRLGPYAHTRHAQQDYDRITAALDGRETILAPGHRVSARYARFDVSDHQEFADPYEADAVALLDAAVAGMSA
jgi:hypothetical protein